TVDIAFIRDQMAAMHTHAQMNVLARRDTTIYISNCLLNSEGRFRRGRHDRKFQQYPVAMTLDQTAAVRRQDISFHVCYELSPSAYHIVFVLFHESNGLDHVSEQYGPLDPTSAFQRLIEIVLKH